MSTNYFLNLISKLSFYKSVVARFFIILFRKEKGIELLYLNYCKEYLFENGFTLIRYRFKNATYYKFGKQNTLEKEIKIFNLKNIEKEQTLTVYGFFRKKTYKIILNPSLKLENSSFSTEFSNLNLRLVETKPLKIGFVEKPPTLKKFYVNNSKIKILNKKIIIKNNSFNQNEFI